MLLYGRCRSGRRWFWVATTVRAWVAGRVDEYGREDTEELALASMGEAVERLGGKPGGRGRPRWATEALKRVNAEKRRAKPAPETTDAIAAEYLYGTHSHFADDGWNTWNRGIHAFQITKKTPRRIYYSRERDDEIGYVDRAVLEHDGEVVNRGRHWSADDFHSYATRELAEESLYGPREETPDLRELRLAAAAVHPDRGGSSEEFAAAFARYEQARTGKESRCGGPWPS
jgi:hypothetical protein